MTRGDVESGTGQCDIRLRVDGESEVTLRGDTVYVRTLSGRDARDDGSECNEPLPSRDVPNFRFEVRDRRGDIRLVSEPSRRGGGAVVRIRDTEGGEGRYHFRVKWNLSGGGGFGPGPGGYGPGPGRPSAGGPDRGPSRWDQSINYSGRGQGWVSRSGGGRQRISAVVVRIERDGRVFTDLNTDRGRMSLTGRIVRVDNDRVAALMRSPDGGEGEMLLLVSGNRVRDISMSGGPGRNRIELNWNER
jgi:hypothetical protein